eukprot:9691653-Lingulodinium_polyedra.AAC.1
MEAATIVTGANTWTAWRRAGCCTQTPAGGRLAGCRESSASARTRSRRRIWAALGWRSCSGRRNGRACRQS